MVNGLSVANAALSCVLPEDASDTRDGNRSEPNRVTQITHRYRRLWSAVQ